MARKRVNKKIKFPLCSAINNKDMKCRFFDVTLVKIATASFVLLALNLWPSLMNLVQSIHWGWFLGVLATSILVLLRHSYK